MIERYTGYYGLVEGEPRPRLPVRNNTYTKASRIKGVCQTGVAGRGRGRGEMGRESSKRKTTGRAHLGEGGDLPAHQCYWSVKKQRGERERC